MEKKKRRAAGRAEGRVGSNGFMNMTSPRCLLEVGGRGEGESKHVQVFVLPTERYLYFIHIHYPATDPPTHSKKEKSSKYSPLLSEIFVLGCLRGHK